MTKYFCDRCETELQIGNVPTLFIVEWPAGAGIFNWVTRQTIASAVESSGASLKRELCAKCAKSLDKWLSPKS